MERFRGIQKADVGIVGAGICGLSIALLLSKAGLRVTILEARTACCGISSYCTGALYLHGHEGKKDERVRHTETIAFHDVGELVRPYGLWNKTGFYRVKRDAEFEKLSSDGVIFSAREYMHLLRFLAERNGVKIFEHARVTGVETNTAYTEHGALQAPFLIIATGYPILNVPGWYFLHLEQRSHALKELCGAELPGICIAEDEKALLIPQARSAVLKWCGGRVGDRRNDRRGDQGIHMILKKTGLDSDGEWRYGMEVHTPDGLPVIGPYGRKTPDLLVAAGFGGRGIIGSMIAARAIGVRVLGFQTADYEVYSPRRFDREWKGSFQTAWRFAKSILLHPQAPKCTHLGCRLVFNPRTRLWECPCHGSCFDDIGHVVQPPAVWEAILRNRKRERK